MSNVVKFRRPTPKPDPKKPKRPFEPQAWMAWLGFFVIVAAIYLYQQFNAG